MRAAAVYRVSTEDQEAAGQDRLAAEFVQREGWELVKEYDETAERGYQSGRDDLLDRPVIQRMLADARKGEFDVVIFKNPTRGTRETVALQEIARDLSEEGVLIAFSESTRGALDWEDQGDQVTIMLGGWMAETDYKQIKANLASGRWKLAQAGGWVSGIVPQGFAMSDAAKNTEGYRHLVVDPEGAEIIAFAFDRILSGDTINEATEALNVRFPDFTGSRGSKGFASSTVARWLAFPAYAGRGGLQWVTPAGVRRRDRGHRCSEYRRNGTKSTYCVRCKDCQHDETAPGLTGLPKCLDCGKQAFRYESPEIIEPGAFDLAQSLIRERVGTWLDARNIPDTGGLKRHLYALVGGRLQHEHVSGERLKMQGLTRPVFKGKGDDRKKVGTERQYRCSHSIPKYKKRWQDRPEYDPCHGWHGLRSDGTRRIRTSTAISAARVEADLLKTLTHLLQDPTYLAELRTANRHIEEAGESRITLADAEAQRDALAAEEVVLAKRSAILSDVAFEAALDDLRKRQETNEADIERLQTEETKAASVEDTYADLQSIGFAALRDVPVPAKAETLPPSGTLAPAEGLPYVISEWQWHLLIVRTAAEQVLSGEQAVLPEEYVDLLAAWADRLDIIGVIKDNGEKTEIEWTINRGAVLSYTSDRSLKTTGEGTRMVLGVMAA